MFHVKQLTRRIGGGRIEVEVVPMWPEFSRRVGLSNELVKVGWKIDRNLVKEIKIEAIRRNLDSSSLVQLLLLEAIEGRLQRGEWGD